LLSNFHKLVKGGPQTRIIIDAHPRRDSAPPAVTIPSWITDCEHACGFTIGANNVGFLIAQTDTLEIAKSIQRKPHIFPYRNISSSFGDPEGHIWRLRPNGLAESLWMAMALAADPSLFVQFRSSIEPQSIAMPESRGGFSNETE
jgi:hypothetical protein